MINMVDSDTLSNSAQDYLGIIYRFHEKNKPVVKIADLTKYINSSPSTVTEMIQRLTAKKYLEHKPFKEVKLTKKGMEQAKKIVRRHRIIERFLTDMLRISPSEVHSEACKLEHTTSTLVEEKLFRALSYPDSCPHGNYIELSRVTDKPFTIYDLKGNDNAIIKKLLDERREILETIYIRGLKVGSSIKILKKYAKRLLLKVDGSSRPLMLDRKIAETIAVEKTIL